MKIIYINGEFKTYSKIPKEWNGTFNYQNSAPSVHYADGWRDLIYPSYNSNTQKLGDPKWVDVVGGEITLAVIDLSENEVKNNILQNAQSEKAQFTRIKLEKQVETELQGLTDDEEILKNQAGYPLWSSFSDQHPFGPNDKVQDFEGNELKMFRIITPHSKQSDRVPINTPALWTKIEFSGGVEVWAQPTGGDGKYPYLDPSTNQPYRVTHNGLIWENNHRNESNHSDPDTLNVWEPGVFGWTQVI